MGTTLYVGTVSEYDFGKKAGEWLAKDGILKVVCINHEVGNVSLDERCQGLMTASSCPAAVRRWWQYRQIRPCPAPHRGLPVRIRTCRRCSLWVPPRPTR